MSEIVTKEYKIVFESHDGKELGYDFFESEGYPDDCYREAERYAEDLINQDSFGAVSYSIKEV